MVGVLMSIEVSLVLLHPPLSQVCVVSVVPCGAPELEGLGFRV